MYNYKTDLIWDDINSEYILLWQIAAAHNDVYMAKVDTI